MLNKFTQTLSEKGKFATFARLKLIEMNWIIYGIVAFFVTFLLMPPFIKLMVKYRLLDKAGGRKIHQGYTAHMGGVVIFIAFICCVVFGLFSTSHFGSPWNITSFLILLCFILLVGVRDDMNNLTPRTKLLCEITVGFLLCYTGVRIHGFYGLFGVQEIPVWLSYVLSIAFMVVVSNAYNLIDGIDGQAGTQALVFFCSMFLFAKCFIGEFTIRPYNDNFANASFWLLVDSAMIGALLGFLIYNWQPARIFMGDTGSLFIGFTLAICMITAMDYNGKSTSTVFSHPMRSNLLACVMFFFFPLADTLRVFISRVRKGKSPFSPDKTHIHHLLLRVGYSHKRIALTTMSIQIIISLISVFVGFLLEDLYYIFYIIIMWFVFVFALRAYVKHKMNKL